MVLHQQISKITLLDGLQMARNSWNFVSPSAIANCFRRAEFVPPSTHSEEVVESESVSSFEIGFDEDCTFDEYVSSDSHLQCSPVLSSAHIADSIRQSTEDAEDSNDDAGDPLPSVTFHQAHSGFLDMKAYLLCSCTESGIEPSYDQLEQLETELLKAHNNS